MAELNFGLLNPPGSQSIGNAFVTGMDQAAAARAQENQNALAQYTLSKAKREDQVKNQLLAELRAATTPEQQQQAYINAGMGREAAEMKGIGLKNLEIEGKIKLLPGQMAASAAATNASNATLMRERQAYANQATRDLAVNPSDDKIRAYGQDAILSGLFTKEETDKITAAQLAIPMEQRAAQFRQAGAAAAAPQVTPAEINTMTQLGIPLTPEGYAAFRASQQPGKMLTPDEFTQQLRLRQEGRPPPQPRAEQPPVAVIDSVTGKPVLVSREEALRGRMTPAAAMESLPPKEIQKREAALPQATSSVKGFESKSDKFIADLIALRDDPGLDNITGSVFGRIGSVSRAGSRAQARYDKVVAKGGFQALQDLRDASKTGGALGNVSNQEGKQLTASFAAIDRRQNAEDVRAAINQAIADIEGTKTRMREAYDSTYAYKSGGGPQTSKPASAAPNIDALLEKYP